MFTRKCSIKDHHFGLYLDKGGQLKRVKLSVRQERKKERERERDSEWICVRKTELDDMLRERETVCDDRERERERERERQSGLC